MKLALVTTTINIPTVLKLYRACSEDVRFFVAGDMKSDSEALTRFCYEEIENCVSFDYLDQLANVWKCSELIGWNTIARRNYATLQALKWGADLIVTVDDDNIPLATDYFDWFKKAVCNPFDGPQARGRTGWFDVGKLLQPKAPHRGFPHTNTGSAAIEPVVGAKVGVAAGICLGDPDIGAVERIANHPIVHGVSEVLRSGIVVDSKTWTVFNSQNTAFLRELAPCFLMVPQFGRYDDIFASLVAQRVMRERDLHVHFGKPFVWQQRNPHDLLKDLTAEMFGMKRILDFAQALDRIDISNHSVLDSVRTIYESLGTLGWMPAGVGELADAWCADLETIL